jgi:hypothetical protein
MTSSACLKLYIARGRKCLGFKTPFQALVAELGKDIQIRFS